VKIAKHRVNEGLSAINNCHARDEQTQAWAATDEEMACEDATERPGDADLDAAAPGASGQLAKFLAEFGRLLEEEQRRTDSELAAFRLALLIEIGDVGGVVKP
jgi:hypothetical protein